MQDFDFSEIKFFDDLFMAPHSRHTAMDDEEIKNERISNTDAFDVFVRFVVNCCELSLKFIKENQELSLDFANKLQPFISTFIFNQNAKLPARNDSFYLETEKNLNDVLCCRIAKKTNQNGTFKFHGYTFTIEDLHPCHKYVDICITESEIYGELMQVEMRGKETIRKPIQRVELRLLDFLTDGRGESAPIVLKNIIYDFLIYKKFFCCL